MSLEIKALHKNAFREIFNLIDKDKDGKIDKSGLQELFRMINYQVTEAQFSEITAKLFKKDLITFDEFMKVFHLKLTDYTKEDVYNAFRLIAKDDDKYIPLEKFKKILKKHGLAEVEIEFLTRQLDLYKESGDKINYIDFLKSLSI